jgi:copper homeostasis protein
MVSQLFWTGEKNVVEGIVILSELVIKAKNRIVIMRRITCIKYWFIKENTNAFFYHSSAIVNLSETADGVEINAMQNNFEIVVIGLLS